MVQIKQWQGGVVAAPQRVTGVQPVQSGAGELSKGMQAVGELFYGFQDEVDTADAKTADSQLGKLIQDRLYAEGTGYMYAQGGDAVARREALVKQMEADRESILSNLSAPARSRAELSMTSRVNQALETANKHAAAEGRGYLNAASEARITTFMNDAIFEPEQRSQKMIAVDTEIRDLAQREGWAPEVVALKRREARSEVHTGIISRIANADPSAALDYLRKNKADMLGETVATLEEKLAPEAKRQRGRQLGVAAAGGESPVYETNAVIEYSMGPKRPHRPNERVVSLIGRAAEDVLGAGARVVITSGTEGDLPQHGSHRHKTGLAADVAFYTPDGRRIKSGDPEFPALAKRAASLGALGIGFGGEYMGGDHMHIDLVPHDPKQGTAPVWASGAKGLEADLRAAMDQYRSSAAGGYEALLDIADPLERKAAIDEYELRAGAKDIAIKAARESATMAGWQLIESGGSIEDLTFAQKTSIGMSGVEKLRNIEKDLRSGVKYQTDSQVFVNLHEMAASDPAGLAALDPMEYRTVLNDTDFKWLLETRTHINQKGGTVQSPIEIAPARQVISLAMQAAGLDPKKASGAKQQAAVEESLLKWGASYREANKRPPTDIEVRQFINNKLTEVVLDPAGLGNKQSGPAATLNIQGTPKLVNGQVIRENAVDMDALLTSNLQIDGIRVPRADIEAMRDGMVEVLGYEPSPQDVIDGLIASGVYTNGR